MKAILLLVILFIIGCSNSHKEIVKPLATDSLNIYNAILRYEEVKNIIKSSSKDTIFLLLNKNFPREIKLDMPSKSKVKFIPSPNGYPKFRKFSIKKETKISFESLNIDSNFAEAEIFINSAELLGRFKLNKRDNVWFVVNYESIRF